MDRLEVQFNACLIEDEMGRTIIYPKNGKSGFVIDSDEKLQAARDAFITCFKKHNFTALQEYYETIDKIFKDAEIYSKHLSRFVFFDKQALGYSYSQLAKLLLGSVAFISCGYVATITRTYNSTNKIIGYACILFFGLCLVATLLLLLRKLYLKSKN